MSIPDETLARWAAWPWPGTPGPWALHTCGCILSEHDTIVFGQPDDPNGEVLAIAPEMREAIDVLVAEVRRLREALEQSECSCLEGLCPRCATLRGDA